MEDISGDYTLDVAHSRLGFSARHAMVTTVRGAFKDFDGTATIDAANPAASKVEPDHRRRLASTPARRTVTVTSSPATSSTSTPTSS